MKTSKDIGERAYVRHYPNMRGTLSLTGRTCVRLFAHDPVFCQVIQAWLCIPYCSGTFEPNPFYARIGEPAVTVGGTDTGRHVS